MKTQESKGAGLHAWVRLIQDARLRRFDGVVVWKLDRWGRSGVWLHLD